MFAPFAHIKGSLFTLYDLVVGYTTHIMPRFDLNAYLQHISNNKVTLPTYLFIPCLTAVFRLNLALPVPNRVSPPSSRHHLSCDDCVEDKRKN